jgi:PhnB protein
MSQITPHLVVDDAAAAIDFYTKAFGATEQCRMKMPDSDKIMHASVTIGDATVMLAEAMECQESGMKTRSPKQLGGSPVTIHLNVPDVDKTFAQAMSAGATQIMPPMDMFWGDRYGKLVDPFGHEWSVATTIRKMTPEEMQAAAKECFSKPQPVS